MQKGINNNRRVQFNLCAPVARKPKQLENPRPYSNYSDYTSLLHNLEYIFHMDNWNKIPLARPLKNSGKNQDQFCHYHNSLGHWTSACYVLRDAIEQLVREEKLQKFVDQTWERRTPEQTVQNVPNRPLATHTRRNRGRIKLTISTRIHKNESSRSCM